MINPARGEIEAELDGKRWTLCLTLGALAGLEHALGAENLQALGEKLGAGKLNSRELIAIIHAGLAGGGYELDRDSVAEMRVEGGVRGYVEIAARLLTASFPPGDAGGNLDDPGTIA